MVWRWRSGAGRLWNWGDNCSVNGNIIRVDTRRLEEGFLLDDAFGQLNSIWGTDGITIPAHIHTLYDNKEVLPYRQHLKDLLAKHTAESKSFNTMPVKAVRENVSLTTGVGRIEKAPIHAETRNEATVAIKNQSW